MLVAAQFQSPISISEESTYIIIPVSDKNGRSRDLYGDSDTVGSGSTKARSMQTLKLTLVPVGNPLQTLVSIRCVSTTHVEIILQIRKERSSVNSENMIYLNFYKPSRPIRPEQ
jgi:hypothetical protein